MKTEDRLRIQANRILGEYTGTLQGILHWEIPEELKIKLEEKIKELKNTKIIEDEKKKNK